LKTQSRLIDQLPVLFFSELNSRIATIDQAGGDVIRLDIGSPDLHPPDFIIDALKESSLEKNHHGYGSHRGTASLRCAWAQMYQRIFDVDLDPEPDVLPLLGTKEGVFHMAVATVERGDIVLVPDPGYVTYSRGAIFAGAEPYYMPLLPDNDYLPDLEAIPPDVVKRAKLLWLNYPNNPTAAVATLDYFKQAVEFARRHKLIVCHDAAYCQVTFEDGVAPSILQVDGALDVAVEFNSLSKSHNMAGWRVGAILGNRKVLESLFILKTNADSGHFRPILDAAAAALTGDQNWIKERNEIYHQRRDIVLRGLHDMGLNADKPLASMYVWCPIPEGWLSNEFVAAALENCQVSMTPGTLFGKHGEGFARISLTADIDRLQVAMERLAYWLSGGNTV